MFFGDFNSWDDVMSRFEVDNPPSGVTPIFASYSQEGYEGSALVIYAHKGRLWLVSGSHCSCYGLEGQWSPEETTVGALVHLIDNGDYSYRVGDENVPALKKCLERLNIEGWESMDPNELAFLIRLMF